MKITKGVISRGEGANINVAATSAEDVRLIFFGDESFASSLTPNFLPSGL